MITWPALCPAGSTFWNKTSRSQLPINRISSSFFCAASTGITEINRMQYGFFRRTNVSKLNFASGRTGRTAGPASSTLVKLSLKISKEFFQNFWKIFSQILGKTPINKCEILSFFTTRLLLTFLNTFSVLSYNRRTFPNYFKSHQNFCAITPHLQFLKSCFEIYQEDLSNFHQNIF